MDFGIVAGDVDQTIYVRLRDSTTGLAKTGLVFNSAGAVCSYTLPGAARAAITLATQTVTGAHSDGGFVEVDATNCKGLYRLDLPDAAVASGKYSIISIEFDGIIEESVIVPLTHRKSDVRQWLGTAPAIPTVAGVPEVDVTHLLGTAWLAPGTAGTPDVNMKLISGDSAAADNLEAAYDGTGYVAATAPAQQQQVANIAVTGAALNVVAGSRTLTTGTEVNLYTDTFTADGVHHEIDDVAGAIDIYYEFDVGAPGVATGVDWTGYLSGATNTMKVYAWNWSGAAWDQLGNIPGVSSAIDGEETFDLTSAHTGTGGSDGLVRIRFANTGMTAPLLATERLLVGYASVLLATDIVSSGAITTSGGAVTTVTNLTNAPADSAGVTTLLSRIPAALFSGITSLAQWLGLMAGKQTGDATARTEIRATGAGAGTFDETTDSQQAIRDNMGAAGAGLTDLGGFSTTAKGQIQTEAEEALQSHHVVLVKTTIATLASQTSFTLTAGSADTDAYNGCEIVIEDSATPAQKAVGVVSDYTGATKTITLLNDPAVFTMAVGDVVTIRPSRSLKPAVDNRTILVNASGHVERVTLNDTTTTNTDMRGTNSAALASVCTETRLAELDAANLPADVAARATPSQVNAEVLDVLNVDTFAEPGQEAPPATTTLVKKIGYTYKSLRNKKTQTATERKLYADDGTTVDQKATDSDDGTTYTKGELGTGP